MKDCKGQKIRLGSKLKCVNDVYYGVIYKVVRWGDCTYMCIVDEDENIMLLSDFADENGRLIDFERI